MLKFLLATAIFLGGYSAIAQPSWISASQVVAQAQDTDAKVTQVKVTGELNDYDFAVTIDSPDTGCDRYADWWEVITPEGELLYRRVLLHSHVDEQPFERSGGPVAIEPGQEVIVRVHTSSDGYSKFARRGTAVSGFTAVTLAEDFANNLESVEPLPQNCAF